jgi:hypothetical protein
MGWSNTAFPVIIPELLDTYVYTMNPSGFPKNTRHATVITNNALSHFKIDPISY